MINDEQVIEPVLKIMGIEIPESLLHDPVVIGSILAGFAIVASCGYWKYKRKT